jgi:phosphoglucosamine mutase
MKRKLFGTDGMRGTANAGFMNAETALKLALAAGLHFRRGDHRHRVVVGKDTRLSGYLFEPALTAGFISMGMDVVLVGPIPTPAIAMLTRSMRADLGVMISASHNPYQDNGIKLFGPDGYKLSDEVEAEIEGRMELPFEPDLADAKALGRATRFEDARGRYIEFVKSTFPRGLTLDGLRIVVDCANGAAYKVAPAVLWELGADVIPVAVSPDGTNINRNCGAVDTATLREQVAAHGADLGIALDGDADRLVLSDEKGREIDGDQVMALIAEGWRRDGLLKGGGVVSTVMSNLGLERFITGMGLTLERTPVGDRYVVEHMRGHGFNLGGEQSGHVVLADYGTTGDGLIAALQVLAEILRAGRPASEVLRKFEPVPQQLRNIRFEGESPLKRPEAERAISEAEKRLSGCGRLLVRKSGTEPVIRVMAESDDAALLSEVLDEVCAVLGRAP